MERMGKESSSGSHSQSPKEPSDIFYSLLLYHFSTNWTQACHHEATTVFSASALLTTKLVTNLEIATESLAVIKGMLPTHQNFCSSLAYTINGSRQTGRPVRASTCSSGQWALTYNYGCGRWHVCLQVRNIQWYGHVLVILMPKLLLRPRFKKALGGEPSNA